MVAVIGDIHGCYFTLVELHNKIKKNYPDIQIYTVGDLVDRGNNSTEVINFIFNENILFTPGNHDYMFYHYFRDPDSIFARSWVFNGNETTLASYEADEDLIPIHIERIKNAPLYFDLDDCFISHAGVSSYYGKILPENFRDDLEILSKIIYSDYKTDTGVLWTRDTLLDLGKLQVVGHTKQREIILDEDSSAIYIDTGACVGNKLSAVIVHQSEIIDTLDEKTHLNDII
ncbi:MAG: metallophosphoesterase [Melioribacteraceae bacterium]|nr:metallophosphoesterase [Melioribacteraceae bacterium]MCF8263629.1 metallophosphoesterase [Melioribacteraceae bacterium]MCF8412064.1 metallophosphoesterase [Melioribacteraceae bacterium]MCF8431334.1 metallophosphoesterase [Melioribacteraceae bacterium]